MNSIAFSLLRPFLYALPLLFSPACSPTPEKPPEPESTLIEEWVAKRYAQRIGDSYDCSIAVAPAELSSSQRSEAGAEGVGYSYSGSLKTTKQGYALIGFDQELRYAAIPPGFSVPIKGIVVATRLTDGQWALKGVTPEITPEIFLAEATSPSANSRAVVVGTANSPSELAALKQSHK